LSSILYYIRRGGVNSPERRKNRAFRNSGETGGKKKAQRSDETGKKEMDLERKERCQVGGEIGEREQLSY